RASMYVSLSQPPIFTTGLVRLPLELRNMRLERSQAVLFFYNNDFIHSHRFDSALLHEIHRDRENIAVAFRSEFQGEFFHCVPLWVNLYLHSYSKYIKCFFFSFLFYLRLV